MVAPHSIRRYSRASEPERCPVRPSPLNSTDVPVGDAEQQKAAVDRKAAESLWLIENREAIDSWNKYVKEHGLPLAKYRVF